ncbi:MAG: hypothetical protein HC890_04585 [Chloroflexaceae bacterium]|nr:hypothetical protein [Chloroflexaceae bacterium]
MNPNSVSQSIGNNSGQAIAAGGNVYASQNVTQTAAESISQEKALELLAEVEKLIQGAALPEETKELAATYAKTAKLEAKQPEPPKASIAENLGKATKLLQSSSTTVEAAGTLVEKLRGPVSILGTWLGKAIAYFLV